MAALSAAEVAQHAYNAGWRGLDLVQAVAYAWIESGFSAEAVSETGCGGLWQLCPKPSGWSDPQTNANAAYAKWKACRGGSFACDWTPYDGGSNNPGWAEGLKQAQDAVKGVAGSVAQDVTVAGTGMLKGKRADPWGIGQSITDAVGYTGSVAGTIGQRVQGGGTLLAGLAVLAGGLALVTWLFLTRTETGREVAQATKKASRDLALAVPK